MRLVYAYRKCGSEYEMKIQALAYFAVQIVP